MKAVAHPAFAVAYPQRCTWFAKDQSVFSGLRPSHGQAGSNPKVRLADEPPRMLGVFLRNRLQNLREANPSLFVIDKLPGTSLHLVLHGDSHRFSVSGRREANDLEHFPAEFISLLDRVLANPLY